MATKNGLDPLTTTKFITCHLMAIEFICHYRMMTEFGDQNLMATKFDHRNLNGNQNGFSHHTIMVTQTFLVTTPPTQFFFQF
jgi:hypothetical protein